MSAKDIDDIETIEATAPAAPTLRVVDAHATPEEIAAIVTVLSSLGGTAPAPKPQRSQWAHPGRQMRPALAHGRGGWRATSLPH
ncbi:acyl-CoA carboxylase subunit epsilon [Nocardioides sp. Iso805N]|uniref:acyl-CoA carboxylase subunit epsilon n=1 Tax=Nocardioides sp. Iso805N TaxID=1283287 RepID=UPI000368C3EB|nr:acyl-CoA carboxylase subunit epsilon [Nocardioides sp. Iso805N]